MMTAADRDFKLGLLEEVLEKMDECAELIRSLNDDRISSYCLAAFEGKDAGWLGHFERDILQESLDAQLAQNDASLARAEAGKALSVEEAAALLTCAGDDLARLLEHAGRLRDLGWGHTVTYSRKVFVPLTMLCRDHCHYCTFAQPPRQGERAYMTLAEVLAVPRNTLALVSGHSGRDKIVELTGLGPALVERRLTSASAPDRGRKDRRP